GPRLTHSRHKTAGFADRDGSFRLDVGRADHFGPFLGFLSYELAEVRRRERQRDAAKVGKAGLDLMIGESGVDLLVEPLDDLGRRAVWCADAEPITGLVARHELSHGRDVR